MAAYDHRGPSFVFPSGVPAQGDLVAVWAGWDTCLNTGRLGKRPTLKREVRVKSITGTPRQGVSSQKIRVGTLAESGQNRRRRLNDDLYLYATNTATYIDPVAGNDSDAVRWLPEEVS